MEDYLEDDWGQNDDWNEVEDFIPADPFESLNAREQDMFFRVLDLIEDDKREAAIEYFMDNPAKIRVVVDDVKQKKEMIENKDTEALKALFEQERIVIEKIDHMDLENV